MLILISPYRHEHEGSLEELLERFWVAIRGPVGEFPGAQKSCRRGSKSCGNGRFADTLENTRDAQSRYLRPSFNDHPILLTRQSDQTLAIRGVQDAQGDSVKQQTSIEFQSLMAWLGGSIENEPILQKHVSLRYPGTGHWLLAHPVLKSWLQKDASAGDKGNVLWCYGPGKVSIVSILGCNIEGDMG